MDSAPSKEAAEEALRILTSDNTYKGGLSLKIQEPLESHPDRTVNKFAGAILNLKNSYPISLDIAPHNKNWEHLSEQGVQKIKIYPPWDTYLPLHVKAGFVTGSLLRFMRLSSTEELACLSAYKFFAELSILGYPPAFLKNSLRNLTSRWGPTDLIKNLLNFLKLSKDSDANSLARITAKPTNKQLPVAGQR